MIQSPSPNNFCFVSRLKDNIPTILARPTLRKGWPHQPRNENLKRHPIPKNQRLILDKLGHPIQGFRVQNIKASLLALVARFTNKAERDNYY